MEVDLAAVWCHRTVGGLPVQMTPSAANMMRLEEGGGGRGVRGNGEEGERGRAAPSVHDLQTGPHFLTAFIEIQMIKLTCVKVQLTRV